MSRLLRPSWRWVRSGVLAAGLGLVAGGFESLLIALTAPLSLGFQDGVVLGLCAMAAGAALGGLIGLFVGAALQRPMRAWEDARAYSALVGGSAFLLCGFYFWTGALDFWAAERVPAALSMACWPVGVAGLVWVNAKYYARREELGAEARLGWRWVSLGLGLALVLLSAWLGGRERFGSAQALDGDPNVLIVTIDTLRRDHVGAYGGTAAATPHLDRLAAEGVRFDDAVTPTPETAPAHASLFTALHPLRHRVLSNGGRLPDGITTLAERLEAEGYATGAFVSSFAVSHGVGLDQGFEVYDDDFAPVRGLGQLTAARWATRALMRLGAPHRVPWLLERRGVDTVDLALGWVSQRGAHPWLLWVHLFEPHAPYEAPDATVDHRALLSQPGHTYTEAERAELRRLYAREVEAADAQVGRLLDALDAGGLRERTLVLVTADHGEQLGEHGIDFHHHGLYEESVRVPLLLRAPGKRFRDAVVPHQVRLLDVAPTALEWIGLDPFEPAEGVELFGYPLGLRRLSLVADLVGRASADSGDGCLLGMRAEATQGEDARRVKYILSPATGEERLYALDTDPGELTDIGAAQPQALEACRARVAPSVEAADCSAELSPSTRAGLEALGYLDRPEP